MVQCNTILFGSGGFPVVIVQVSALGQLNNENRIPSLIFE